MFIKMDTIVNSAVCLGFLQFFLCLAFLDTLVDIFINILVNLFDIGRIDCVQTTVLILNELLSVIVNYLGFIHTLVDKRIEVSDIVILNDTILHISHQFAGILVIGTDRLQHRDKFCTVVQILVVTVILID